MLSGISVFPYTDDENGGACIKNRIRRMIMIVAAIIIVAAILIIGRIALRIPIAAEAKKRADAPGNEIGRASGRERV